MTRNRTHGECVRLAGELLARMTREEKIGQLTQRCIGDTSGLGNAATGSNNDLHNMIRKGRVGVLLQPALHMKRDVLEAQRVAVEETRLGIPMMTHTDVIHGFDTVFPLPVAAACSFDPSLIRQSCAVGAKEATACGINVTCAPMVDIARDPRWGRIAEGCGEDPFLCAAISEASVRGYQEDGPDPALRMSATLKHFAGYGAGEGGRDYNETQIGGLTMQNVYTVPFKAGIDAGARYVMAGFHSVDGMPVTASRYHLTTLLRGVLGFDGAVISDFTAIRELIQHGVAETPREAALAAFSAGVDIEMMSDCYDSSLESLFADGSLDEASLDAAVLRLLTIKYEVGLMDDPYLFLKREEYTSLDPAHLALAERLADESIVLLKNEGALPVSKGTPAAVCGSRANDRSLLGCWQSSRFAKDVPTLTEGLIAEGLDVIPAPTPEEIRTAPADCVIAFIGEPDSASGEGCSRSDINVTEEDLALLRAAKEAGKKVISVICTGRPMVITQADALSDAVVYAWYLGHRMAASVAGVLTGRVVPSGKLSCSLPRSIGQIPVHYDHLNTGRPRNAQDNDRFTSRYTDGSSEPLYPFGHGLSYAAFTYSPLSLSSPAQGCLPLTVSVEVTNAGSVTAAEAVQLYIRDVSAEIGRPVKELKGFARVTLAPGETRRVSFDLTEKELAYTHPDGTRRADPGRFTLWVGGSSAGGSEGSFILG